jgi:hypothetical protein
MVMTRLPSWGEPILPEVWKLSEEEINAKFPLPMIPGETSSSISLLDHDDNDCPLLQMSDPYQEMDNDLASLMWQKGEPHLSSTDLTATDVTSSSRTSDDIMGDDEDDEDDDNSMLFCRSDYLEDREGLVDDQESECSLAEDCWETTSDDMNVDQEKQKMPSSEKKAEPNIAWAIEAQYDRYQSLCFKLKLPGGAYMLVLEGEVLDSVGALLEDDMENVFFKVQGVDGQSMLVEPSRVIAKVSEMIDNEPRNKCRLEVRDECEDTTRHSGRKHALRITSLGRRKGRPEKPKCPTRFGSAWRALAGRSKIRPRQLARVE